MCEVDVTVNDNDAGGPYHFVPCDKPATQTIHRTTPDGQDVTVGLCAFHATGEL